VLERDRREFGEVTFWILADYELAEDVRVEQKETHSLQKTLLRGRVRGVLKVENVIL
jgi:hypothetical protein